MWHTQNDLFIKIDTSPFYNHIWNKKAKWTDTILMVLHFQMMMINGIRNTLIIYQIERRDHLLAHNNIFQMYANYSRTSGWLVTDFFFLYYIFLEMISGLEDSTYDNLRWYKLCPFFLLDFQHIANLNLGRTNCKFPKSWGSQIRSHYYPRVMNYTSTLATIFFRFSKTGG